VVTLGELELSSVAEFKLSSGAMLRARARAGGLVYFVDNDTDQSHTWGNFQYAGGRDRGWTERLHSLARLVEDDGRALDGLKGILKKASLSKDGMRAVLRKTPQPEAARRPYQRKKVERSTGGCPQRVPYGGNGRRLVRTVTTRRTT
jgi:hypothetical protein